MKNIFRVIIICIIWFSESFSQLSFSISSNKSVYEYGETIEVYIKVQNNTNAAITGFGEVLYPVRLDLKNVNTRHYSSTADGWIYFLPGMSRTWIYRLVPGVLGIPVQSGEQVFIGSGFDCLDSLKVSAPKYYGGRLFIIAALNKAQKEIKDLRDSIGVKVVSSDTSFDAGKIYEYWQITNKNIDSLAHHYLHDSRLEWIEPWRIINHDEMLVTSVNTSIKIVDNYSLSQNYPNPFNPCTTIRYSIPSLPSPLQGEGSRVRSVTLKVYDLLGREVATLVNEKKQTGNYEVKFNGAGLQSGIYFYRMMTDGFTQTKKLVLLK